MALFRRFFYQKPPEGLLEIAERAYVFDSCFSTDMLDDDTYRVQMQRIAGQLREQFSDSPFLVFNFREGEQKSQLMDILSPYDMPVMDYPRQYEGCPILSLQMIHHFLRSSDSWISLEGNRNIVLFHCERAGWPTLAFMLAGFLLYRKLYTGEQKALDLLHREAPRGLLRLLSPLNPMPSQIRYLQYITQRNTAPQEWPPPDQALTLDCIVLRAVPGFDTEGGCRPIVRIYGFDPQDKGDQTTRMLFNTVKKHKSVRYFRQADCNVVKIDIQCAVQGDVVLECIHVNADLDREEVMFRVMFNTAFIRSNVLMLGKDDIDVPWDVKERYTKDFHAEVLFASTDSSFTVNVQPRLLGGEVKSGLAIEDLVRVQELFDKMDWTDGKRDEAFMFLQQISSAAGIPQSGQVELNGKAARSDKEGNKGQDGQEPSRFDALEPELSMPPNTPSLPMPPSTAPPLPPSSNAPLLSMPPSTTPSRIDALEQQIPESSVPSNTPSLPIPPSTAPPLLPSSNAPLLSMSPLTTPSRIDPLEQQNPELSAPSNPPSQLMLPSTAFPPPSSSKPSTSQAPPPHSPHPAASGEKVPSQPSAAPVPDAPSGTHFSQSQLDASPPDFPTPGVKASPSSGTEAPSTAPPPPDAEGPEVQPPPDVNGPSASPPSLEVKAPLSSGTEAPSTAPPSLGAKGPETQPPPKARGPPAPPPLPGAKGPPAAPPPPGAKGTGPPPPPPPGGRGKAGGAPPPPVPLSQNPKSTLGTSSVLGAKKASLKPFHWVKVTRAIQGSLWAEAQKNNGIAGRPKIDVTELASLFSAAISTDGAAGSRGRALPKSEKIHLIDMQRAKNCEIMLTKVKMPLPDVVTAILALDGSILDIDQVGNLLKYCPTKEEMETLKGYNGDKEKLGKCEQFFLEIMKVPRVESKLRVFLFKLQFAIQVGDLQKGLNIVICASKEVRESLKLQEILHTILSIGNALNQGTARGSAIGFKLDSLLKLSDMRAKDNKTTLMHYLVKVLSDTPDLLEFHKDLAHLEEASKVQLKFFAEEMQAVNKSLEKVNLELTESENDGSVSEGFQKNLKTFLDAAETDVRSLTSLFSEAGRNADALAQYFGEDPARCPFEQVVSVLLNFVVMFKRAHNENCQLAEIEKKKAEREAEQEKLKRSPSKKNSNVVKKDAEVGLASKISKIAEAIKR